MEVGVCDVKSENFEQDFLKSVINTGFAVVTQHGIDHGLIRDCQQAWKSFYKRDQVYKNMFVNGNNPNMGYKGMGTETAVGAKVADLKEFFHWRKGEELPANAFESTNKLFMQLENLGLRFLVTLEKQVGANYLEDCTQSANTLLRTLYYPALKGVDHSEGAVRAAAHEDINYITLLVAASAPGLEVMDTQGRWHQVPHEENSIAINVGDMIQLQSNGFYKSTTHRVVNPPDDISDRISMPLFIHPKPEVVLAPGITAGKFLKERIDQIHGKK